MKDATSTTAHFMVQDDTDRTIHEMTVLRVARELLAGFESPLWRAIRGKGLSYDFGLLLRSDQNTDYFYLGDCTSVGESYEAAVDVMEKYCNEGVSEEEMDGAVGGTCFSLCSTLDEPGDNALRRFVNNEDLEYVQKMLMELKSVTKSEVEECIRSVLKKLFVMELSCFIITCPEDKVKEIEEDFREFGFEVKVKEYESLLSESFYSYLFENTFFIIKRSR